MDCQNTRASGGCIFLIQRRLVDSEADIFFDGLAPGRVANLRVNSCTSSMSIWGVHNFDIKDSEMNAIQVKLRADTLQAKMDPLSFTTWVLGDWDVPAPNEGRTNAFPCTGSPSTFRSPTLRPIQRGWQQLLQELTELQQVHPTHFRRNPMHVSTESTHRSLDGG